MHYWKCDKCGVESTELMREVLIPGQVRYNQLCAKCNDEFILIFNSAERVREKMFDAWLNPLRVKDYDVS